MLQNGLSLHVGGANSQGMSTDTHYVFDETQYLPGVTGSRIERRWEYGITSLPTGRVPIIGGTSSTGSPSTSAEVFEPDANIYIILPQLVIQSGRTMTLQTQTALSGTITWAAKYGTITSAGVYVAPTTIPSGFDKSTTTLHEQILASVSRSSATATAEISVLLQ